MRSIVDRRQIKPCRHKGEEWPYLPTKVIQERLWQRIRKEGECWVWFGWSKGTWPLLHLTGKGKDAKKAHACHLAWWLEKGQRIELPQTLRRTCDEKMCINPAHREQHNRVRNRRWNAREVRILRETYWGHGLQAGLRPRRNSTTQANTRAARKLGVSRSAMGNFVKGKARLAKWGTVTRSPEGVEAVLRQAKAEVLADQRRQARSLSMATLAKREGVAISVMAKMLNGVLYKAAGGPTGPAPSGVRQPHERLS